MDHANNISSIAWWWQALGSPSGIYTLAVGGIALPLLLLALRAWLRLKPARPAHAEAGTATLEFALVFPILLALMLILLQTTLVMTGNFFVHYAAFAATRSAIVQIPRDLSPTDGYANIIYPDSAKSQAIQQAAVVAVMPIAGRLNEDQIDLRLDVERFRDGVAAHFAGFGQDAPGWVDTQLRNRLRYAAARTQTQVMVTDISPLQEVQYTPIAAAGQQFGPRDPVTVEVTHDLNLSIPYARMLFASGTQETAGGPGAFTRITARYTLTNEGTDRSLPPRPPLPRRDE